MTPLKNLRLSGVYSKIKHKNTRTACASYSPEKHEGKGTNAAADNIKTFILHMGLCCTSQRFLMTTENWQAKEKTFQQPKFIRSTTCEKCCMCGILTSIDFGKLFTSSCYMKTVGNRS